MMEKNKKPAGSGFATASLVFGILALVSALFMTVLPPFFFGGLSLILGILSRGSNPKHFNHALAGIVISASALVVNIAICSLSFVMVFSNPEMRTEYWSMVDQAYEQMTGLDFEEVLKGYGLEMR